MTYLGTNLTPDEYYANLSKTYFNPHQDAVFDLIDRMVPEYPAANILDLGCGPGLATQIIQQRNSGCTFVGMDSSEEMVRRYEDERKCTGILGTFWSEYPKVDVIIAAHCLHLCPDERLYQTMTCMIQSGAVRLFITSPNKHTVEKFDFPVMFYRQARSGEKEKTIHGWCLNLEG